MNKTCLTCGKWLPTSSNDAGCSCKPKSLPSQAEKCPKHKSPEPCTLCDIFKAKEKAYNNFQDHFASKKVSGKEKAEILAEIKELKVVAKFWGRCKQVDGRDYPQAELINNIHALVEDLHAELMQTQGVAGTLVDENRELKAENARYREALEKIAKQDVPFEKDSTLHFDCRLQAATALDLYRQSDGSLPTELTEPPYQVDKSNPFPTDS